MHRSGTPGSSGWADGLTWSVCSRTRRSVADLSRARASWLAGLCILAGSLLLWSAPALAQRGHAFAFSFGGEGSGEGQFSAGGPVGVAVDDLRGLLYVVDAGGNRVERFTCTASSCAYLSSFAIASPGAIAVDNSAGPSAGDVYVVENVSKKKTVVAKLDPQGVPVLNKKGKPVTLKGIAKTEPFAAIDGLAVDSSGDLWVYEATGRIDGFGNARENEFLASVKSGVEHKPVAAPGLAVGSEGELYVGHEGESGAPTIAKLYSSGQPFPGLEEFGGKASSAVAVDKSSSDVYIDTGFAVAALSPTGSLIQEFGRLTQGRGVAVDSEYGNVYVADSATREVDVFTLEPAPAPFPGELALPDGRAWELVSPPAKEGATIEPIRLVGGAIQASADGNSIAYIAASAIEAEPEGAREPEAPQILSTRIAGAWRSKDIATPNSRQSGSQVAAPQEYRLFSSDLSLALVQPHGPLTPLAEPPLSPPALAGETQEKTMYLRDDAPISPTPLPPQASEQEHKLNEEQNAAYTTARENGEAMKNPGYLPLVTALDDSKEPFEPFGSKLTFLDGTPDLTHVVLDSQVALTQSKSTVQSPSNLYEWAGRRLAPVSVLPGAEEEPAPAPVLGSPAIQNQRHAISSDGSRVFWTNDATQHLYMRDMQRGETLMLDAAQSVEEPPEAGAVFQTASADGSKVFFTDRQRLTEAAKVPPPQGQQSEEGTGFADLYEFDVNSGTLTDLTPDTRPGEYAGVQGVVLGASEDGSYVYFVADGVLADGAAPGNCQAGERGEKVPVPGTTCNLYLWHNGTIKFIAVLSSEDAPDWQQAAQGLGTVTSRVSPNGRYAAFMSDRPLTGYDNRDANSGHPDEEVYLYDASSERLVCASCNPTGARPTGVLDTQESGEGLWLLVDRPHTWDVKGTDPWLAGSIPGWTTEGQFIAIYQSRYLSDSGRLLFDSADALSPQVKARTRAEEVNGKKAQVGVENVYQYEPPGVGSCTSSAGTFSAASGGCVGLISSGTSPHESAFLDASVSGNDVFFITAEKLLPQVTETSHSLYDAHVCEAASPCAPPPSTPASPCEGEACQGPSSPAPSFAAPGSATGSGSGNIIQNPQVLGTKEAAKPKPLTRAQKLAKALKSCKKLKTKKKRLACEKQARKKYGPLKAKAKKSSSQQTSARAVRR